MNYKILYENSQEDLIQRLLKIRNIQDNPNNFLKPTFSNYWIDPYKLKDFEKGINKITNSIKKNERIVIFWDYDADWITWSYSLYQFFTKFLWYKNITIRLPDRMKDWYWIRKKHIKEAKEIWANLIITVDNWITALKEAKYAKEIWIEMIITDHHNPLEELPEAHSIINPQISDDYHFKWLAWVWVVFKLIIALSNKFIKKRRDKKLILNYFLPIVSIWTVADCVPLLNENRLFVKKWLELINTSQEIPFSLRNFINFLNIKWNIDSFHIWFIIGPRLNASWRLLSPYDSLYCLLYWNPQKQIRYLEKIEETNTNRKNIQEKTFQEAEKMINWEDNILVAYGEDFHEGIIWIVSWRITEKYNKPSIVLNINNKEKTAVASLRGPEYFNIIKMLKKAEQYLERYGWHKQAWGLTVKTENLEKIIQIFQDYCKKNIKEEELEKKPQVDTEILSHEINKEKLLKIDELWPFGEWNPQPKFLIKDIIINSAQKVGKNWNWHMKLQVEKDWKKFPVLFRRKWEEIDKIEKNISKNLIGKIKKDNFNWGFFVDWEKLI